MYTDDGVNRESLFERLDTTGRGNHVAFVIFQDTQEDFDQVVALEFIQPAMEKEQQQTLSCRSHLNNIPRLVLTIAQRSQMRPSAYSAVPCKSRLYHACLYPGVIPILVEHSHTRP